MTKQLFTTQENHYSLTISRLGLRETVGYSMSLWERTIERKVCELVENCLLYELSTLYERKDIGLCRELAVFKNKRGPESKKLKNQFRLYSRRTS